MLALIALGGIILVMFVLCLCTIVLLFCIFWIWMLVDCIRNQHISGNERLLWALLIFFLHTIGAIIYFFVARSGKRAVAAV